MDAAGVYMRQKWPGLADTVLALADVDVRSAEYGEGRVTYGMQWAWRIVKAWLGGLAGGKKEL